MFGEELPPLQPGDRVTFFVSVKKTYREGTVIEQNGHIVTIQWDKYSWASKYNRSQLKLVEP